MDLMIQDPSTLTHSHPIDILPAPDHWLRGHPAEMMKHLEATRGQWIPKMVHRSDPLGPGAWGRWNDVGDKEYGFSEVKGFWFAGEKDARNAGECNQSHRFLPKLTSLDRITPSGAWRTSWPALSRRRLPLWYSC